MKWRMCAARAGALFCVLNCPRRQSLLPIPQFLKHVRKSVGLSSTQTVLVNTDLSVQYFLRSGQMGPYDPQLRFFLDPVVWVHIKDVLESIERLVDQPFQLVARRLESTARV